MSIPPLNTEILNPSSQYFSWHISKPVLNCGKDNAYFMLDLSQKAEKWLNTYFNPSFLGHLCRAHSHQCAKAPWFRTADLSCFTTDLTTIYTAVKKILAQLLYLTYCVQLFATPQTVACQAPLSMGFPRQEYWNGLPFPIPEDHPHPGIELASLMSPTLAGRFFTTRASWETYYNPILLG